MYIRIEKFLKALIKNGAMEEHALLNAVSFQIRNPDLRKFLFSIPVLDNLVYDVNIAKKALEYCISAGYIKYADNSDILHITEKGYKWLDDKELSNRNFYLPWLIPTIISILSLIKSFY